MPVLVRVCNAYTHKRHTHALLSLSPMARAALKPIDEYSRYDKGYTNSRHRYLASIYQSRYIEARADNIAMKIVLWLLFT